MMSKKKLSISIFLLFICSLLANAQSIKSIQAYYKMDGTRYISLLSDNTLWWFSSGKQWQQIPQKNLPLQPIKFLDAFVRIGFGDNETRVVTVLEDNSIWWYADGEDWNQVNTTTLPKESSIKEFKSYLKPGAMGISESRLIVVLNDNSIWWYALGKKWEQVSAKGMPENAEIKFLRTYQKLGTMSSETRFVVVLNDNSLWWFADGNNWKAIDKKEMPSNSTINQFEIYMKTIPGFSTTQEGRLVAVTDNQTIHWRGANDKAWRLLTHKGLPAERKILTFRNYQKNNGFASETRFIAQLDDNTLWWYADGKAWTPVPMSGLPFSK